MFLLGEKNPSEGSRATVGGVGQWGSTGGGAV